MSNESWLNLLFSMLLSVPVGLATALLTPRLDRWLRMRNKASLAKRRHQTLVEAERIVFYRRNPEVLTQFLVVGVVRTFLLGFAILGVTAILPVAVAASGVSNRKLLIAVPLAFVAGVVAVIIESRAFTDLYWRVRYFDLWMESLPPDLQMELKGRESLDVEE